MRSGLNHAGDPGGLAGIKKMGEEKIHNGFLHD
jgi:hypothetical protein